jgi:large subunit ribosomal protein L4e
MKVPVYSLDGSATRQAELPQVFGETVRPDLINRAAMAVRSASFQPKGPYWKAGLQTSASYVGRRRAYRTMINIERARLPKVKLPKGRFGDVKVVPQSRGGRPAHPPHVGAVLVERINRKERRKAIRSAIAATTSKELAIARGHRVAALKELPIVVDSSFEKLKKSKEVAAVLGKLGLGEELERASEKKIRAGRGKSRGRKYRRRRAALIVVAEDGGIIRAAENLPGIDVSLAKDLNADLLAPGGVPGRLTIYTETALKALEKLFVIK